eukprot:scaffold5440_cov32-Tisochrysis_lutea.AAC.5
MAAVPQVRAKPIVEGTIKKMTASITALTIGFIVVLPLPRLRTLALLSAVISAASCAVCFVSGRLYHAAMWSQIERRELVLKEDEDTYGEHYRHINNLAIVKHSFRSTASGASQCQTSRSLRRKGL